MNKKGVGIIFNWLFAIIVGVLIFLFLVGFAVKNTDLFGKVTGQEVIELLDIAFTDFKSNSIGTLIYFGDDVELDFSCKDSREVVRINGKGIDGGTRLKGNIVFAPKNMKNIEFALWSVPWRVPFRVTNFIFVSDQTYNFVGGRNGMDESQVPVRITENLPKINGNNLFDVGDENGEKVTFVESLTGITCGGDKRIYYQYDPKYDGFHGTLCVDGNEHRFVGDAMLYAYIFSDKREFECLETLAYDKADLIKKIYIKKSEQMGFDCNSENLRNLDFTRIDDVKDVIQDNEQLIRGPCGGLLF